MMVRTGGEHKAKLAADFREALDLDRTIDEFAQKAILLQEGTVLFTVYEIARWLAEQPKGMPPEQIAGYLLALRWEISEFGVRRVR